MKTPNPKISKFVLLATVVVSVATFLGKKIAGFNDDPVMIVIVVLALIAIIYFVSKWADENFKQ